MKTRDLAAVKRAFSIIDSANAYNSANIISLSIIGSDGSGGQNRQGNTVTLKPGDTGFDQLLTLYSSKITAQKTAMQSILTSLNITKE